MKKYFGILICSLILYTCSSSDSEEGTPPPTEANFERSELLMSWADNIIIPSYQAFDASLAEMQTALETFNVTTNEVNLLAFRQAWEDAYMVWQRVSLFENGPAESVNYRDNINIYPTDPNTIEQNIADGNANLELPSNRDAKGFPALDYLINGSAASDTEILARFDDPAEGALLFSYTEAIVDEMVTLTAGVLAEWENGFRDTFVENDGSSINASVDRIVNDYIFYYEFPLRRIKVELASGVRGNDPTPTLLEAFYAGNISNQLCLEALQSAQDFFNGVSFENNTNGIGLDDYLNALEAENLEGISLTEVINDQFNLARTTIENLASFQEELETNPPLELINAVQELNRLIPLIKTDMLSFLNINVDFQDNDGD